MYDLDHCRVCKQDLPPRLKEWAHRRIEEQTCSPECNARDIKRRFACCDEAEFSPCVCMYSFTCKKHGDIHIGTHD